MGEVGREKGVFLGRWRRMWMSGWNAAAGREEG